MAAMVATALPSSRWLTNTKVLRFRPAVFPSSISALPAALFCAYAPLQLRLALASEQAEVFEEMRTRALRSSAVEAAGCLDYVVNYYASGTKQLPPYCFSGAKWTLAQRASFAEQPQNREPI